MHLVLQVNRGRNIGETISVTAIKITVVTSTAAAAAAILELVFSLQVIWLGSAFLLEELIEFEWHKLVDKKGIKPRHALWQI